MSAVRRIEILRAGWGAALLLAPEQVLTRLHRVSVDPASVTVARVLGLRHLTQAAFSGLSPSPEVLAVGVWVDATHACSAVGLAVVDPDRARAGLVDAVVAGSWAALGCRDLASGGAAAPARDRRRDRLAGWALGWLPLGKPLRRLAAERRPG